MNIKALLQPMASSILRIAFFAMVVGLITSLPFSVATVFDNYGGRFWERVGDVYNGPIVYKTHSVVVALLNWFAAFAVLFFVLFLCGSILWRINHSVRIWLSRFIALYLGFLIVSLVGFFPVKDNIGRTMQYFVQLFIVTLFVYLFVAVPWYGLTSLFSKRFTGHPRLQDLFFVFVFMVSAALFIFWPASSGFSYGDSHGEIISNGVITAYGFHVKYWSLARSAMTGILYFSICWAISFSISRIEQQIT